MSKCESRIKQPIQKSLRAAPARLTQPAVHGVKAGRTYFQGGAPSTRYQVAITQPWVGTVWLTTIGPTGQVASVGAQVTVQLYGAGTDGAGTDVVVALRHDRDGAVAPAVLRQHTGPWVSSGGARGATS